MASLGLNSAQIRVHDDSRAISRRRLAHCHRLRVVHTVRMKNGNITEFAQMYGPAHRTSHGGVGGGRQASKLVKPILRFPSDDDTRRSTSSTVSGSEGASEDGEDDESVHSTYRDFLLGFTFCSVCYLFYLHWKFFDCCGKSGNSKETYDCVL